MARSIQNLKGRASGGDVRKKIFHKVYGKGKLTLTISESMVEKEGEGLIQS